MATLKIRMVDTADGPRITVDYESDPGALGHEHERDHREAVAALLGVGVAELEAMGVAIERAPVAVADDARRADEPVAGGAAVTEGRR